MAIGTPVALGQSAAPTTVTSATVVMTTTAAVAVGDVIVATVGSSTANRVLNSVTDSAGNTYTIRRSSPASTINTYIATAPCTTILPSGGTITATFASSLSSLMAVEAFKVSGAQNAMDVAATGSTGSVVAWSATIVPVSPNSLVVGCSSLLDTRANTPGTNYTEIAEIQGSGGNKYSHAAVWRLLATPASQTPGGTWAGAAAWASAAIVLPPIVNPATETSIDDFNRADGTIDTGAGAATWTRAMVDGSVTVPDLRTYSNAVGSGAGNVWRSSYTKLKIDNSSGNCDIVIDCVTPPAAPNNEFGLWCLVTNPGTSSFNAYVVIFSGGTWILRRMSNGANAGNITTAAGTLVAGDSIWFQKVGSALKVFKKPSGGNYAQILSATDANHNPASGVVAIELSDSTARFDNLRGGPMLIPQAGASDSWSVSDSANVAFSSPKSYVVGQASAAAASVAIPPYLKGDMLIVACRGNTAFNPQAPTPGGTVPAWSTLQAGNANALGLGTFGFVADNDAPGITTGTFGNTTHIAVLVVRKPGAGSQAVASALGFGSASSANTNNTATCIYPALALTDADGSSMGIRTAVRVTATNAFGSTPPPGWVTSAAQPSPTASLVMQTLYGIAADPTADTVSALGANAATRAHTIEITLIGPQAADSWSVSDGAGRAPATTGRQANDSWSVDDGTEGAVGKFAPDSISGLVCWFDPSKLGLSPGEQVTTLPDSGGRGHNAVAYGTTNPTVGAKGLHFTGGATTSSMMKVAGLATDMQGLAGYTVFGCYRPKSLASNYPVLIYAPADNGWKWLLEYNTDGQIYCGQGGGYKLFAAPTVLNAWAQLSWTQNGATPRLWQNGVEITTGGASTIPIPVQGAEIGADAVINGYLTNQYGFDGDMGELVIYDHVLTDIERQQVESYLNAKWLGVEAGPISTSASDAWSVSDTAIRIAQTWVRPTSDVVAVSDSVAGTPKLRRAANDSVAVSDSAGGVVQQVTIPGLHPVTQAYIDATGLPGSFALALDGLVTGLKSKGLWTKMKAIYPMVGGTAALHQWNLVDPRDTDAAYRLTFNGGAHSTALGYRPNPQGALSNGGYADTHLVPLGLLDQDSTHLAYYSLLDVPAASRCEMGCFNWTGTSNSRFHIIARYTPTMFYYGMSEEGTSNVDVPAASGLFVSTRTASGAQAAYRNGAQLAASNASSIGLPPSSVWVGGINSFVDRSDLPCGFASVGAGLTPQNVADLNAVVQEYQAALGRATTGFVSPRANDAWDVGDAATRVSARRSLPTDSWTVSDSASVPKTTFAPSDITGLGVWFDASQLALADGAAVDPWPNLANVSVPGTMLGDTPAQARPKVHANAKNGLPVVRFSASEARMRVQSTGIDKDWTLVYVARMVGPTPGRVVNSIYPTGGNLLVGWWTTQQDVMYDAGFTVPNMQTTVEMPGPWKMYSADGMSADPPNAIPATSRLFSDGTLLGSTGTAAGWGNCFAISGYDPFSSAETCDCEIAEVVQYSRKLSDAERAQVEDYLRKKWLATIVSVPTTATDSWSVADTAARLPKVTRPSSDSVTVSDAAGLIKGAGRTATDSWTTSDVAARGPGTQSYALVVLADRPTLYWRMNETGGTVVADASGNGHPGTLVGGAWGVPSPLDDGTALHLQFTDSITTPSFASAQTAPFTVECWLNRYGLAAPVLWEGVFAKTTNSGWGDGFGMFFHQAPKPWHAWVGNYSTQYVPFDMNTGVWVHFVMAYDGTTLRVYLNGLLVGSAAVTSPPISNAASLAVGNFVGSNPYRGDIDEFAFYNYALSPEQIATHLAPGVAPAFVRAPSDVVTVSDSTTRATVRARPAADSVAVSDSANRVRGAARGAADSWSVSSTATRGPAIVNERMLATVDPQTKASGAYTLGIRFTPTADGQITHVRYWGGDNSPAGIPRTVSVWKADGTKLATATDPAGPATGWREAALSTPLDVVAGTLYIAGFSAGTAAAPSGEFGYTAPLPASLAPHLNADIAMNSSGYDTCPTQVAVGYTYHVDVVYHAVPTPMFTRTAVDAIATSDSVGRAPGARARSAVDSVAVSSTATRAAGRILKANDLWSVSGSAVRVLGRVRSVFDSWTVGDEAIVIVRLDTEKLLSARVRVNGKRRQVEVYTPLDLVRISAETPQVRVDSFEPLVSVVLPDGPQVRAGPVEHPLVRVSGSGYAVRVDASKTMVQVKENS